MSQSLQGFRKTQAVVNANHRLLPYKDNQAKLANKPTFGAYNTNVGDILENMPLFGFTEKAKTKNRDTVFASFTVVEKPSTDEESMSLYRFAGVSTRYCNAMDAHESALALMVSGATTVANFSKDTLFPGMLVTARPPPTDANELAQYRKDLNINAQYRNVVPGFFQALGNVGATKLLNNSYSWMSTNDGLEAPISELIPRSNSSGSLSKTKEIGLRLKMLILHIAAVLNANANGGTIDGTWATDVGLYDYNDRNTNLTTQSAQDIFNLFSGSSIQQLVTNNPDHKRFLNEGFTNQISLLNNLVRADTEQVVGRVIKKGSPQSLEETHINFF